MKALCNALRRMADYVDYVRERGYLLEVGPVRPLHRVSGSQREGNAFEIGRSHRRGKSLQWPMVAEVLQPLADASRVGPPERGGL